MVKRGRVIIDNDSENNQRNRRNRRTRRNMNTREETIPGRQRRQVSAISKTGIVNIVTPDTSSSPNPSGGKKRMKINKKYMKKKTIKKNISKK